MPNDCCQKLLQFIAVCVAHSTLSASISSVRIDKVLASLRFRKVYVLKASFSKTFLQITDVISFQLQANPIDFETQISLQV